MTDWKKCHLEKEFYHQMLNLAQFYLDNPTIVPCEFFTYDISWTLADESFTALCNIGNFRQENIIHVICVFRLFVVKKNQVN